MYITWLIVYPFRFVDEGSDQILSSMEELSQEEDNRHSVTDSDEALIAETQQTSSSPVNDNDDNEYNKECVQTETEQSNENDTGIKIWRRRDL